jgi:RND family efflux transporter MFP subunit
VYSKRRVEVAAEVSGTLAAVAYDVGDEVAKGATVFRLKAQNAKLNLTRSRKGFDAAQTQRKQAERELARMKELYAAGAATPAALDAAQAAVDNATVAVEQAEVTVDMGQTGIGDTRTRAPIAGVVVDRFRDPGEAVTSMPPTVVLVIEDLSLLEVRVRIPELDLRHIDKGTSLQAHFPALGVTKEIVVARLGSSIDPATRTIEVVANVDNADRRLKPGMSVEVVATGDPADASP